MYRLKMFIILTLVEVVASMKGCQHPLGMEDGRIKNQQITVSSAYENNFKSYGGQNARLNKHTPPQGYRSNPNSASTIWLQIDFMEPVIITSIATQGYGDDSVSEWMEAYNIFYANNNSKSFKSPSKYVLDKMVFRGNNDRHRVQLNYLPFPVIAQTVLIMPNTTESHGRNVAFRMELYGCKPGYYFVAWIMIWKMEFNVQLLYPHTEMYQKLEEEVLFMVSKRLDRIPGFFSVRLTAFSPKVKPPTNIQYVVAELEIHCIESQMKLILNELQKLKNSSNFFDPSYLSANYPNKKDCLPARINTGLDKNKMPYTAHYLTKFVVMWKITSETRCHYDFMKSVIGCSHTGVDTLTGRFKIHQSLNINNGRVIIGRNFFIYYKTTVVYFTCFSRLIVNKTLVGETYDYGFFLTQKRGISLVAKINGRNFVLKGSKHVYLNAEGSYFSLQQWNGYHGLNLTWTCQTNGKYIPVLDDTENNPAVLGTTTKFSHVKIELDKIMTASNYTVTLEATFNGAMYTKTIKHFSRPKIHEEPLFNISCQGNCGLRSKKNVPRLFSPICKGSACSHIIDYSWEVLYENKTASEVCIGNIATKRNSRILELTDFSCPGLGTLDVTCEAIFNSYKNIKTSASMKMVLVNTTRSCSINPSKGKVLQTSYKVHCSGWENCGLSAPRYRFVLRSAASDVLLQSSDSTMPNMTTILPVGNARNGYRVNLYVNITYEDGETVREDLVTKVEPIGMSELLNILENGTKNQPSFVDLIRKGDINTAASIAISALSVFQDKEKKSSIDKDVEKKVKTTVVQGFLAATVKKIDEVHKLIYIITLCCQSSDNQASVLRILNNTIHFLTKKINSSPEALSMLKRCFHGIGSIIETAYNKHAGQVDNSLIQSKALSTVKTGIDLVDQIASDSSSALTKVNSSFTFTSPIVDVLVTRHGAMALQNSGANIKFQGAKISVPSNLLTTSDGYNVNHHDIIDFKIQLWTKNPYSWHETSTFINSSVLDIKIELRVQTQTTRSQNSTNNCGNEINRNCSSSFHNGTFNTSKHDIQTQKTSKITNLKQPIHLLIPQVSNPQFPNNVSHEEDKPKVNFLQLSSKQQQKFRYHELEIPSSPYAITRVAIKPSLNVQLYVLVQYSTKPTIDKYILNRTIPDFSSCHFLEESQGYYNCASDPFSFSLSWNDTGHQGQHYIGILSYGERVNGTLAEQTREWPSSNPGATMLRMKRSLNPCDAKRRTKRSCVEYKAPPPPSAGRFYSVDPREVPNVNYTLKLSSGTCMFWSTKHQQWKTDGCELGLLSTKSHVHCLCDHLTAFGGDFFVAHNPLDYDKVWKSFIALPQSGNIGVLATVCVLLAIYVIGLVILRHFDKKDKEKVINTTIELQSTESNPYQYKVQLETGIWKNSGTTAEVGMMIYGENYCSGPICLTDSGKPFARATLNTFHILVDESFGSLVKIRVWHNNGGDDPDWYLHQAIVTDTQTNEKWYFFVNRWLATNRADGSLSFEAKTFDKGDHSRFKDFFTIRAARGFANDHLWISLFTRPPHSPFTRCQRFACCMSILFTAMIANAMFYKMGGRDVDDSFFIGPLKLSLTAIKIGVQSAIIAIPVNVIIVTIFKKSQGKKDQDSQTENKTRCQKLMVCVAWFLCNASILVSAVYVVFYSMQWGKTISNNWLTSVAVSSIQDVFVTGPIKVILMAGILASVLKSPPKEEIVSAINKQSVVRGSNRIVQQPEEEELERAKLYNERKTKLFKVLRGMLRLIILFLLFSSVCYGNRDRSRFMLTKAVKEIFHKYEKVHRPRDFWNWTKVVLVPGLYNTTWYNNDQFKYPEGYISNRDAFVIGIPRLRQIRIKPIGLCIGSVTVPCINDLFKRCIPLFSTTYEDRGPFYLPKWKPVGNISQSDVNIFCPKAWQYKESVGYDGIFLASGGYIADLGYQANFALATITDLENNNWVDDRTSSVFIEFTVFEPSSRLLCIVRYTYEKFLNGGASMRTSLKTIAIYPPSDSKLAGFLYICKMALLLYVLILFILEIRKAFCKKCDYFRKLWSWLDLLLILLCVGSLVLSSSLAYIAGRFISKVRADPFKNWSTDALVFYSDLEVALLGFILFILTIRMIKIVSFNRPILVMLLSLKSSAKPLFSFSLTFLLTVTAFSMLAHITFGTNVFVYSSLHKSFLEVFRLGSFGGSIDFKLLHRLSPIVGTMYMFSLRVIMTLILINFFIAILNFSYALSNAESSENNKMFENLVLKEFAKKEMKHAHVWERVKENVILMVERIEDALPSLLKPHVRRPSIKRKKSKTSKNDNLPDKEQQLLMDSSFVENPVQSNDSLHSRSNSFDQSTDDFDDIEFLDEDDLMIEIRRSMSEISISLAESLQDYSDYSSVKLQSDSLGQGAGQKSTPSESLLYSASSPRSNAFTRSNRSIDVQSRDDLSEWSFNSDYYRINEDYSRRF